MVGSSLMGSWCQQSKGSFFLLLPFQYLRLISKITKTSGCFRFELIGIAFFNDSKEVMCLYILNTKPST